MANEKELNPSPAEVEGEFKQIDVDARLGQEWGTLSPNPDLEDKLEKGEHGIGQPTNPNFNDKVEPEPIKTKNEVIRLIQQYGGGGGSEPVVAYEGTILLPENVEFSDWSLHRAIKDGNILWVVVSGTITNNGDASATWQDVMEITLPSSIGSKIYRRDGSTLDQAGNDYILFAPATVASSTSYHLRLFSNTPNKLKASISLERTIDVGSANYQSIECRVPLFLDIGSNE